MTALSVARRRLNQAAFAKANRLPIPNHDMVEYPDLHQRQRLLQPLRQDLVRPTGFGHARGVVVHQNDGGRIEGKRSFHYFARINRRSIERTAKQLLERQYPMSVVEK